MNALPAYFAKFALFAAIVAGAAGVQASPQQPHVFTPVCAAPPHCAAHTCLRSGRCTLGAQVQPMGCLIYTCKKGGAR